MRFRSVRSALILFLFQNTSPLLFNGSIPLAHAINQSGTTPWSPFGPSSSSLIFTVYSDFSTMFTNFQSGQIDITDWPMFPSDVSSLCANPDFFCGSQQSEFGMFQLDINHHASLLGVAQQQVRTTTAPGIISSTTTAKGVDFRKALAYLLDKPEFILSSTLQGRASCDDLWASPSQNLPYGSCAPASDGVASIPQTILDQECSDHPWFNPGNCHPTSAYLLNNTSLGPGVLWWAATGSSTGSDKGYPSMTDLHAACDDLVSAGFAIAPVGKTCADIPSASARLPTPACATTTPYSCPHLVATGQLVFYIRTHSPRKAFGQIMADGLNFLFGTPNNGAPSGGTSCTVNYGYKSPGAGCTPTYYTITDIGGIIFGSNPLDT